MIVGNGGNKDIQGKYNAITTLGESTRAIHDGTEFTITAEGSIPASGSVKFLGVTGTNQVHFDEFVGDFAQGDIRISLYESPTVTDNGTLTPGICDNHEKNTTAEMLVYAGPTTSANGTLKSKRFLPLTGGGANVSPRNGGIAKGKVLKRNTTYLFLIENLDTNTAVSYGAEFSWHESDIILD